MAYKKTVYQLGRQNDVEYTYKGNYGARGEKRSPKKKLTKEQIKKQNQRNKENRIRRTIILNFRKGDLWCCNKYPKGIRPPLTEVRKDFKEFRKILRRQYQERGGELKYIYRIEVGTRGGIHIHYVVNRLPGQETDWIITLAWELTLKKSGKRNGWSAKRTDGLVDYRTIYDSGGYEGLAAYICKIPDPEEDLEEYRQLTLFPPEERKILVEVQTSRTLIRPEEVKQEKTYSHWTMRRILRDGPEASDGFYIDPDSVVSGINPYTGMSYLRYREIRKGGKDP
jgi:hypothetical protein